MVISEKVPVSIIVPIKNEADNLRALLKRTQVGK